MSFRDKLLQTIFKCFNYAKINFYHIFNIFDI